MYDSQSYNTPEQQLTNKQIFTELGTYPFKASTYFQVAMANPLMWSPSKGLQVPYIGKRLAQGTLKNLPSDVITGFKETYTQGLRRAVRGTLSGTKKFFSSAFTLGLTEKSGGGYIGGEWLNKTKYTKPAQELYNRVYDESKKLYGKSKNANIRSIASAQKAVRDARTGSKFHDLGYKGHEVHYGDISKVRGKKITTIGLKRRLAKIGLGGMKAASTVGLAMLAYDITSMIAKPLAQVGITALNNIAMDWQNRFMPEMGGQLQLSYLNRTNATERQRAISALSKSNLNGRMAMGNEAQMMY